MYKVSTGRSKHLKRKVGAVTSPAGVTEPAPGMLPLIPISPSPHWFGQTKPQVKQPGALLKSLKQIRIFSNAQHPALSDTSPPLPSLSTYASGHRKGRLAYHCHCPSCSCLMPAGAVGNFYMGSQAWPGTALVAGEFAYTEPVPRLVGNTQESQAGRGTMAATAPVPS